MKSHRGCATLAFVAAVFMVVDFVAVPVYSTSTLTKNCEKTANTRAHTTDRKPNIIIMLADDTGYADFQSFGHPSQEWTGVDRMVKEGMKFTHWSTPVAMCTPSRAALLTGRYPIRNGIFGTLKVFGPTASGGLPDGEITIAEALKDAGYKTGMVGKWHLGINAYNSSDGSHLPKHHGFDYVGINIPLSTLSFCDPAKFSVQEMGSCFVYNNDKIIEQPINLDTLTSRLLRDSKNFITENKDHPFFFYLSFPQTHVAIFASSKYTGSSKRGLYGDMVNEMGSAVDQVLDHLIDLGIEKNTLVFFTSDHGPIREGCGEDGAMGFFRGGKATTWEGGVRIPAVAWWPGKITPGTVDHSLISLMDLFPTALNLAGVDNFTTNNDVLVDGKSFHEILQRKKKDERHQEALFYYCDHILSAVRYGKYKIYYYTTASLPFDIRDIHGERPHCHIRELQDLIQITLDGACENITKKQEIPLVFDVEADPEELVLLNTNKPEIQKLLEKVADIVKKHEDSIVPVESEIDKPALASLFPCCNPPRCECNYKPPATNSYNHA